MTTAIKNPGREVLKNVWKVVAVLLALAAVLMVAAPVLLIFSDALSLLAVFSSAFLMALIILIGTACFLWMVWSDE